MAAARVTCSRVAEDDSSSDKGAGAFSPQPLPGAIATVTAAPSTPSSSSSPRFSFPTVTTPASSCAMTVPAPAAHSLSSPHKSLSLLLPPLSHTLPFASSASAPVSPVASPLLVTRSRDSRDDLFPQLRSPLAATAMPSTSTGGASLLLPTLSATSSCSTSSPSLSANSPSATSPPSSAVSSAPSSPHPYHHHHYNHHHPLHHHHHHHYPHQQQQQQQQSDGSSNSTGSLRLSRQSRLTVDTSRAQLLTPSTLSYPHYQQQQQQQQQQQPAAPHSATTPIMSPMPASPFTATSDSALLGQQLHHHLHQQQQQQQLPFQFPQPSPLSSSASAPRDPKKASLYKTELCRSWEETGTCKYGSKCQFAHSRAELRNVPRHPRYKTEVCRTFWEQGWCPYGKRCCFIHNEPLKDGSNASPTAAATPAFSPAPSPLLNMNPMPVSAPPYSAATGFDQLPGALLYPLSPVNTPPMMRSRVPSAPLSTALPSSLMHATTRPTSPTGANNYWPMSHRHNSDDSGIVSNNSSSSHHEYAMSHSQESYINSPVLDQPRMPPFSPSTLSVLGSPNMSQPATTTVAQFKSQSLGRSSRHRRSGAATTSPTVSSRHITAGALADPHTPPSSEKETHSPSDLAKPGELKGDKSQSGSSSRRRRRRRRPSLVSVTQQHQQQNSSNLQQQQQQQLMSAYDDILALLVHMRANSAPTAQQRPSALLPLPRSTRSVDHAVQDDLPPMSPQLYRSLQRYHTLLQLSAGSGQQQQHMPAMAYPHLQHYQQQVQSPVLPDIDLQELERLVQTLPMPSAFGDQAFSPHHGGPASYPSSPAFSKSRGLLSPIQIPPSSPSLDLFSPGLPSAASSVFLRDAFDPSPLSPSLQRDRTAPGASPPQRSALLGPRLQSSAASTFSVSSTCSSSSSSSTHSSSTSATSSAVSSIIATTSAMTGTTATGSPRIPDPRRDLALSLASLDPRSRPSVVAAVSASASAPTSIAAYPAAEQDYFTSDPYYHQHSHQDEAAYLRLVSD